MMDSQCIPEIPPSPLKYSISLYCLSDFQDEREFIDDTNLIPERQPEPLLYEIDLHSAEDCLIPERQPEPLLYQIDLHSAENPPFIPEEPPIPLEHNIPSDDLSGPIPEMGSSLQLNAPRPTFISFMKTLLGRLIPDMAGRSIDQTPSEMAIMNLGRKMLKQYR